MGRLRPGWYIPAGDQSRAVILVHGRNASRTDLFLGGGLKLAKALHDVGLSVMMIDLRGHGQSSDGRFTYGLKERKDVIGAVDWLIGKGYQPGKIGTMGISLRLSGRDWRSRRRCPNWRAGIGQRLRRDLPDDPAALGGGKWSALYSWYLRQE